MRHLFCFIIFFCGFISNCTAQKSAKLLHFGVEQLDFSSPDSILNFDYQTKAFHGAFEYVNKGASGRFDMSYAVGNDSIRHFDIGFQIGHVFLNKKRFQVPLHVGLAYFRQNHVAFEYTGINLNIAASARFFVTNWMAVTGRIQRATFVVSYKNGEAIPDNESVSFKGTAMSVGLTFFLQAGK